MPYKFSRFAKLDEEFLAKHDALAEAHEARASAESAEIASACDELQDAHRKETAELFGIFSDHLAALDVQLAKDQIVDTPSKLRKFLATDSKDRTAQRRKASLEFAKKVGLDVKRYKTHNANWGTKFNKALTRLKTGSRTAELYDFLNPEHETGWSVYGPPYAGWQYNVEPYQNGGFTAAAHRALDPNAGFIRNEVRLDNPSAGDLDVGRIIQDTQLALNHTAKATGPLEIRLHGQVNQAKIDYDTYDEIGWSDSTTYFQHWIMAHVVHPNTDSVMLAEMGRDELKTDETIWRSVQTLPNYSNISVIFRTDGSIAQGETVVVRFGCSSLLWGRSNDIEMHQKASNAWHFYKVEIRTLLP